MDKLLNSNEKFPEQHYRSKKRSTNTYDDRTLNQNDSLSGSYSCQCSTNSVSVVEVQSSISTLRVIRDFDNGFSGNLKNIHWHVQHSQISILCDLISWKRKGQALGLLHRKFKSARWTWRRWLSVRRIYISSRSDLRSRIHRRIPGDRKIGSVIEMKVVQIITDHG